MGRRRALWKPSIQCFLLGVPSCEFHVFFNIFNIFWGGEQCWMQTLCSCRLFRILSIQYTHDWYTYMLIKHPGLCRIPRIMLSTVDFADTVQVKSRAASCKNLGFLELCTHLPYSAMFFPWFTIILNSLRSPEKLKSIFKKQISLVPFAEYLMLVTFCQVPWITLCRVPYALWSTLFGVSWTTLCWVPYAEYPMPSTPWHWSLMEYRGLPHAEYLMLTTLCRVPWITLCRVPYALWSTLCRVPWSTVCRVH